MHQGALISGARCHNLQQALQLQEAEAARLQQQLAESSREVAAARSRVAEAERRLHETVEAADSKTRAAHAQAGSQRTQLLQRVTKAEAKQHVRTAARMPWLPMH